MKNPNPAPIFSVSELNEALNHHLGLLGKLTVEGELSQLNISHNKWVFFNLKDDSSTVKGFGILFQLQNIRSLQDGMLVRVSGTPRLHQKSGRFSIFTDSITPSGMGSIKQALENLKSKLQNEGLFEPTRKRPLPLFPQKVGLITAKNSQAYLDFVKICWEQAFNLQLFFYPSKVQGDNASESVIQALNHLQTLDLDVIVITRGGGSLEDLMAFNHESVVRAVFSSKIPTIVAIGHEGDQSLAELAADVRGSTPTNAGQILVRHRQEISAEIDHLFSQLDHHLNFRLHKQKQSLFALFSDLNTNIQAPLQKISHTVSHFHNLSQNLHHRLDHLKLQTAHQSQTANKSIQNRFNSLKTQLASSHRLLLSNNPQNILKKGYSISTLPNGKVIKSFRQLSTGQTIYSSFQTGSSLSIIKTLSHDKKTSIA